MSRITADSKCRLCKAAGKKLFLKGSRCFSPKCPIDKKGATPPGMHGIKSNRKQTDYGLQLKAKQQVKRLYGVNETQFKNLYLKAKRMKGLVGDNLVSLLECRLDNVVYQSGFSTSRSHARQLISHGHITVNQGVVTVASYSVSPKDTIVLDKKTIDKHAESLRYQGKDFQPPEWLDVDRSKVTASIVSLPQNSSNQDLNINLIIEYYSR